ncbi:preprotein translocase subunit SecE [Patescibacteria group bacterium]
MEKPKAKKLPKIGITKFIREVINELKKVNWPTREDTVKLTVVVVVLSLIVGAFIGMLDLIFLRVTSILY